MKDLIHNPCLGALKRVVLDHDEAPVDPQTPSSDVYLLGKGKVVFIPETEGLRPVEIFNGSVRMTVSLEEGAR